MSFKREDLITCPTLVIPYLEYLFYEKIPLVCKPVAMYLVGSRGRTPVVDWEKLDGKDWDVLIVGPRRVNNTRLWGMDNGYYIDIVFNTPEIIERMRQNNYRGSGYGIELFPNTDESVKEFLNK